MRGALRVAKLFATVLLPFFLCWIIFVGTFSRWELLVGVGAALLGATAICVVEGNDDAHFRPTLRAWLTIWRLPWYLLSETGGILWVALRDLIGGKRAESLMRLAPFDVGGECDPQDTGRRALATTYTTMTPSVIVLGVNVRDRYLLFHQLKRGDLGKMAQDLGARP